MTRPDSSARPARLLLAAALGLGACSTAQPQLNGPTSSTSGSPSLTSATTSGSSSTATGSESTSGGSTSTSTTGGSTSSTGSASSGTSSSASSTSGGCSAANFAGSWDTAFAQLTLSQDGGAVVGRYHDWGYTDLDPKYAGTLGGTACGNSLTGTIQANADPAPATLDLTLGGNGIDGTFTSDGGAPQPICGVPSGQGLALPVGCGWSDAFPVSIGAAPFTMIMSQTADEVTGSVQIGTFAELMYGVVSDYRVNGEYLAPVNGRFSFAMIDGVTFVGNEIYNSGLIPWCGVHQGKGVVASSCLGGGGGYDGTWFTNLGTITLSQPILNGSEASPNPTGVWFLWGSQTEYPIAATTEGGLGWTDSSPVGGAVGLIHLPAPNPGVPPPIDGAGVTLEGFTRSGGLWCGVIFNDGAMGGATDPVGTLFQGCGLSNTWNLWQGQSAPTVADLTQTRGQVTGGAGLETLVGQVAFYPAGGSFQPLIVSGSWTDGSESGTFNWYPDGGDGSFSGDSTSAGTTTSWCGSVSGTQPNPCLQ